jgi:hypothetical protein
MRKRFIFSPLQEEVYFFSPLFTAVGAMSIRRCSMTGPVMSSAFLLSLYGG